MPLWASYLVKAYAWRGMFSEGGLIDWLGAPFGLALAGLRADRHHRHAGLPVAAVHDPADLRRARAAAGLAARGVRPTSAARPLARRCAGWCCRWSFPAIVAGLDLHVLAVARRLHRGADRRRHQPDARQRRLRQRRRGQQPAVRGRASRPSRSWSCSSTSPPSAAPAPWRTCERCSARPPAPLAGVFTGAGAGASSTCRWRWWCSTRSTPTGPSPGRRSGLHPALVEGGVRTAPGARDALLTSASRSALLATADRAGARARWLALALQRYRFFGRNAVSLLIILPIALPGIVTGIALNNAFRTILGIELGFCTIVIAHATFCIVTVFNNVHRPAAPARRATSRRRRWTSAPARSRRSGWSPSRCCARRCWPAALLAFGLSLRRDRRDHVHRRRREQTLPIWIFQNLFRPNQAPVVNVVAAVLVLLSRSRSTSPSGCPPGSPSPPPPPPDAVRRWRRRPRRRRRRPRRAARR